MSNLLKQFEDEQMAQLIEGKRYDKFTYGDTVRVNVRIVEGNAERIQAFEGVCIALRTRGLHSSFVVRKISHNEGVERRFPLYSPRIDSIVTVKRGVVRRSKLYYMRALRGKAARIKEKFDFDRSKKKKTA